MVDGVHQAEGAQPMLTAFVMIQAQPEKIADIAQAIANMTNVAEVYSVTGEFDILVVLRLSEYEQLAEAVPDGLARIEGILRTHTVLAFRRFSAKDLEAAWDIGVS
jgi:DNA-binding Lrp family transcriptional regulator